MPHSFTLGLQLNLRRSSGHRVSLPTIQSEMDPFLDLIHLLRPRATLWTRVDASGRWGLSFRQHNDVLFCWVQRGRCELHRPANEVLPLQADDFVLIRTSTPFHLVSEMGVEPTNSETVLKGAGSVATLGDGSGPSTLLRGGRFVFDTANEQLLTGLLPDVLHIAATADCADRLRTLLRMNEAESTQPRPGSDFMIARLMELVLVEILRGYALPDALKPGLIAGLADPVIARALAALHRDVNLSWTTQKLARLCGVSRSSLASRFGRLVGLGPIEYLQRWRMAIAKDELRRGVSSIGEIALAVGFQSGSAFSTAFTRAVGCSPRQFANTTSNDKSHQRK